ncbi:MAG: hypothetical protein ABSC51_06345 [Gaiellaceae bacterium]
MAAAIAGTPIAGTEEPQIKMSPQTRLQLKPQLKEWRAKDQRRSRHKPEYWQEVAQTYRDAWRAGKHPTKAVAETYFLTYSAAAKQIARCRKMELLGHTTRGKPGP